MAKPKSYRLLCPISRALDRVGDRWSLLILRDLHAGPARFGELQHGLVGLASNLLASRLEQLQQDGLIVRRPDPNGGHVYALTPDGDATAPLLFELAALGTRYPPHDELRRPGNLRTVAVTLKEALRRVVDPNDDLRAELVVDDEPFAIRIQDGDVGVDYEADEEAPLRIHTNYEALVDVGDGHMSATEFGKHHIEVAKGTKRDAKALLRLMAAAFGGG
ncbi:MAG: helix-turn-helix domain-containing protein [Myxococcota bacterium]